MTTSLRFLDGEVILPHAAMTQRIRQLGGKGSEDLLAEVDRLVRLCMAPSRHPLLRMLAIEHRRLVLTLLLSGYEHATDPELEQLWQSVVLGPLFVDEGQARVTRRDVARRMAWPEAERQRFVAETLHRLSPLEVSASQQQMLGFDDLMQFSARYHWALKAVSAARATAVTASGRALLDRLSEVLEAEGQAVHAVAQQIIDALASNAEPPAQIPVPFDVLHSAQLAGLSFVAALRLQATGDGEGKMRIGRMNLQALQRLVEDRLQLPTGPRTHLLLCDDEDEWLSIFGQVEYPERVLGGYHPATHTVFLPPQYSQALVRAPWEGDIVPVFVHELAHAVAPRAKPDRLVDLALHEGFAEHVSDLLHEDAERLLSTRLRHPVRFAPSSAYAEERATWETIARALGPENISMPQLLRIAAQGPSLTEGLARWLMPSEPIEQAVHRLEQAVTRALQGAHSQLARLVRDTATQRRTAATGPALAS